MREATDLKETILDVASTLFAKNGYAATSIKKIAQAAGCTTAALYYYFEEGKSHILREVVQSYSNDIVNSVDQEGETEDLTSYLNNLAQRIGQTMPKMSHRLNWLLPELPKLPDKEREQFIGHFLNLYHRIRARLEQYIAEQERANMMAWIIVCAFLGYGQLFQTLAFQNQSAPNLDEFGQALMSIMIQSGAQG